ncbi:hypothetical protein ELUMI_v1c04760 [Williamsoniiplasma luminosum]|uniref:Uncharacterized protein n=1 Tax=Williamsoniiplasma luminosum TaxID=214888 RepID=A0A2K8NTN5_9MOLU|nr:hypothetical protein [Williamsoniiplasma luminosum]ATZ17200.1 hypothetical protein ELUMI_v1c04760 [Williamsoniiplasma luminosum]
MNKILEENEKILKRINQEFEVFENITNEKLIDYIDGLRSSFKSLLQHLNHKYQDCEGTHVSIKVQALTFSSCYYCLHLNYFFEQLDEIQDLFSNKLLLMN